MKNNNSSVNVLSENDGEESKMKTEAKIVKPDLTKSSKDNYLVSENPLLLLAEENGALRALSKNIVFDFSDDDDISRSMLLHLLPKLSQIKNHFSKIEEILLCFLPDEEKKKEIISKEKLILSKLEELSEEMTEFLSHRKEWILLLDDIEKNIIYENHFLLPLMEQRLSEFDLRTIWIAFLGYARCLIP